MAAKTLSIQVAMSANTVTMGGSIAAGVGNAVEWSIVQIDQSLPAPNLVNSVITDYNGTSRNIEAELNCDSSSAITSQSGGISSIGNISTTTCTITINSGFFSSSPWKCLVTPKSALATVPSCSCSSATSCAMTGVVTSYDAYVSISGPK